MLKQAVILVGGLGSRLGERTRSTPKPLLDVAGRPFLDHLIDELTRYRTLERILLLAGHHGEQIIKSYHGKRRRSSLIEVIREPKPLGTGGALVNALQHLDENFLLLNGDSLFDINILDFAAAPLLGDALIRIALKRDHAGNRYGRVELAAGRVSAFLPPTATAQGPINAGIYLVDRRIVAEMPAGPCSLEVTILADLAMRGATEARLYDGYFIDIGVPTDYDRAQHEFAQRFQRPAVFLDRDGVLNRDDGYVHRPDAFEWLEGAKDAVKLCNDAGYFVFVVTNQAGVARGFYGTDAVETLHRWMDQELAAAGAHVEEFEYCPCHPEAILPDFREDSPRRKPAPGMLLDCMRKWPIDRSRSLLVGDKTSDLEAARAAGVAGHHFEGGNLCDFVRQLLSSKRA